MNRLLLTLCSLLLVYDAHAQYKYLSFPTNGTAYWRYKNIQNGAPSSVDELQLTISPNDTIINGKTYKKIMSRSVSYSGAAPSLPYIADAPDSYYAAFREDSMRTYSYTALYGDRVVYDFNKKTGDTIEFITSKARVGTISTVTIANKLRRNFNLIPISNAMFCYPAPANITEGFGGDMGLSPDIFNIAAKNSRAFLCYHNDADTEYYDNPSCNYIYPYGTIPPPTSVSREAISKTSVYPNPFTDALNISNGITGIVTIYNAIGMKMLEEQVSAKAINTQKLPQGVYLLVIKNEQGEITLTQKLQKQ